VLDELLDAVEALRAVDAADDDEEQWAAADAASALVDVTATLHRIAHGDDSQESD
jgi:hypothetical protein